MSSIKELAKIAGHPIVFGAGIGVANGVLAKVRGEPVPIKAMLIIGGVTAVAEAALMSNKSERELGRTLTNFGVLSGVGALAGLALFVDWKKLNRGSMA